MRSADTKNCVGTEPRPEPDRTGEAMAKNQSYHIYHYLIDPSNQESAFALAKEEEKAM